MATDKKKTTKADAAPKKEVVAKPDAVAEPAKAEVGEKVADVPAGYSRGEGQKPVSNAYRDNWNAIYGKTKKKT
jgi:hypothetical protein